MSDSEEHDNKVMKSNEEAAVKPGFKQVGHKKKNLEPVKEETWMDKIKCTRLHYAGKGIAIPVTENDIEVNGVVNTGADATFISVDFASVAGIDTKDCKKACLRKWGRDDCFLKVSLRRYKLAVIPQVDLSMTPLLETQF